jgi:hypothetical protein
MAKPLFLMVFLFLFIHGKAQKYEIDIGEIPQQLTDLLPGIQHTVVLIDAAEDNGNGGYLVLKVRRADFEQTLGGRLLSQFNKKIDSFNFYSSNELCGRLDQNHWFREPATARAIKPLGAEDFRSIKFAYNYLLTAVYFFRTGFGNATVIHRDDNSKLVGVDVKTSFSFAIKDSKEKGKKSLVSSIKIDGTARAFFHECNCVLNSFLSRCSRDINIQNESIAEITVPAGSILESSINAAKGVNITMDEDFYYVYLNL